MIRLSRSDELKIVDWGTVRRVGCVEEDSEEETVGAAPVSSSRLESSKSDESGMVMEDNQMSRKENNKFSWIATTR